MCTTYDEDIEKMNNIYNIYVFMGSADFIFQSH